MASAGSAGQMLGASSTTTRQGCRDNRSHPLRTMSAGVTADIVGACFAPRMPHAPRRVCPAARLRAGRASGSTATVPLAVVLMSADGISVVRVRVGIVLFLLFWLPVYLLAPAIAALLGKEDDVHARRVITIVLVCVQTVLGLLGVSLAGRELFSTLGKVRRRRLVPVACRIVWSGDTRVADVDLRSPKGQVAAGAVPRASDADATAATSASVPRTNAGAVPATADGDGDHESAVPPVRLPAVSEPGTETPSDTTAD